MSALDELNQKWGRDTVRVGAGGVKRSWRMQQTRLSWRYTTRWDELTVVLAG